MFYILFILFILPDPDTQQIHQVWYDNPESLKIKTSLAKQAGMRGVSMWTGYILNHLFWYLFCINTKYRDFVAYQQDPQSAAAFWAAMGYFFL